MDDERRVIVIGSGPSGAMAAHTLVHQGIPVTLLESGQGFPAGWLVRAMGRNVYRSRPEVVDPQRHVASADPNAQWPHALMPGGMSNHWTGAVPRFSPEDFCEGERLHERYRWPLSYEDLVPYYRQVERLLAVTADPRDVPNLPASLVAHKRRLPSQWQEIARHAESVGHGLIPIPLADGSPWMIRRTGTAFNSFTGIIASLRRSPHFHLRLGAHAVRLEWSGEKKKVRDVIYVDRATGSLNRLNAAAVVVAAGPLASTKLLLDSACNDFPDGLGDTEGLLGRYLHDHLSRWWVFESETPLPRLGHAAYLTRAPYRESAPLLAASCTIGHCSHAAREKVLALTPLKTRTFGVITFGTMVPDAANLVRLDRASKDEFGFPKLDVHICHNDQELQTVTAAGERFLSILEAAGYRCTIRESVQKEPGASVHYGGTVRMHASPKYGMLNAWNRLHAVDNVVVADASCFTTGAEKNPTPTVMALAARASHRLAEDLKAS